MLESGQFEISSITLIASTGLQTEIKMMVKDLNIYEDIFSNVVSGEIEMKDGQNLVTTFGMHGNEYLYIKFDTPSLESFEKVFRIYKISNLNLKNLTSFIYKIHFCSEEFILNQQIRISKSYKDITNSDIISDILSNQLNVDPKKIAIIENTIINQNLIIPNMKPFEAINWLSSFSINDKLSTAYMFFETRSGFQFRSLESIYQDEVYKKITINPKNLNDDSDKKITNSFIVDRFEIKQPFDILESISTGGFSSSMVVLDLLRQSTTVSKFDTVNNGVPTLNKYLPYNDAQNRKGNGLIDLSSYIRYFPKFQGGLIEEWLLQRANQFSMLNSFRMNIQLTGDSQMEVGRIIELDFPYIKPINNTDEIVQDESKSGKYLVTSLRHRIFNNKYFNYMEICKDSNNGGVAAADNSNIGYDTARKS